MPNLTKIIDSKNDKNIKKKDVSSTTNKSLTFVSFLALGLINSCSSSSSNTPDKVSNANNDGKHTIVPEPTASYMVSAAYMVQPVGINYQIGGTVVDSSTNQPIVGASIEFMGHTTKSDAKGLWAINMAAEDCTINKLCNITVVPKDGSTYQTVTQPLVDTDTTAQKFVSISNVIKLSTAQENCCAASYMTVQVK